MRVAHEPKSRLANDLEREDTAAFEDYLNFFSLLAHLRKTNKFEKRDIDGLFGYYIKDTAEKPEVMDYLNVPRFEFHDLYCLIRELGPLSLQPRSNQPC